MNEKQAPAVAEMDFKDEHGHSLVEFRQANETEAPLASRTSKIDSNDISQFNHLLSLAPSSAVAAAANSKQLMTCTFDYAKLVQAKDGSGAIGAVYKDGSNLFAAQARFHEAEKLKSLVTTGMILNLASQALAQKHLADINERLKAIELQVQDIHKFLEQGRYSKIGAFQEQLERVGKLLRAGELVHVDTLQAIMKDRHEVRSIVKHIRQDIDVAYTKIRDFNSSSLFGSDDLRSALQDKIDRISHLQRDYLFGMQCLLVANLILFVKHGGNKEFVVASEDYLDELKNEHGVLKQWEKIKCSVDYHLSKMKPIFELARSTQANALLVTAKVTKVQQQIDQDTKMVHELQQRVVRAQKPRVLLELEAGKIVRGYYI